MPQMQVIHTGGYQKNNLGAGFDAMGRMFEHQQDVKAQKSIMEESDKRRAIMREESDKRRAATQAKELEDARIQGSIQTMFEQAVQMINKVVSLEKRGQLYEKVTQWFLQSMSSNPAFEGVTPTDIYNRVIPEIVGSKMIGSPKENQVIDNIKGKELGDQRNIAETDADQMTDISSLMKTIGSLPGQQTGKLSDIDSSRLNLVESAVERDIRYGLDASESIGDYNALTGSLGGSELRMGGVGGALSEQQTGYAPMGIETREMLERIRLLRPAELKEAAINAYDEYVREGLSNSEAAVKVIQQIKGR